jgi:high-affinity nickel-transport protein
VTAGVALSLGFVLGVRHAFDADHLVAIATFVRRATRPLEALGAAALWGLGHSVTLLAVGAVVVATGHALPSRWELFGEAAVAIMLVLLGARALAGRASGADARRTSARARPLVVGVVHGLAGSGFVALLALGAMGTRARAFGYLIAFAVGTVAGMGAVTTALSGALRMGTPRLGVVLSRVAGAASIAMGAVIAVEVVSHAL